MTVYILVGVFVTIPLIGPVHLSIASPEVFNNFEKCYSTLRLNEKNPKFHGECFKKEVIKK